MHDGKALPTPFTQLQLSIIRGYQLVIAPLLAGSCRYVPSCSRYAQEAVLTHGALRGSWMAFRRILRCHPFGGAGVDPVPGRADSLGEGGQPAQTEHTHRHD